MALPDWTFLNSSTQMQRDTAAHLEGIWQRNIPVLSGRLDLLACAAAAAQAETLSDRFRAEAISVAHKLAGSLGMFGFPQGTHLALQLEAAFSSPSLDPDILMDLTEDLRAALHDALASSASR